LSGTIRACRLTTGSAELLFALCWASVISLFQPLFGGNTMKKMMTLAGAVLATSLLAACGEKKAEEAPAAEAPAAEATTEAAPPADAMAPAAEAAPAADAMAPAAEAPPAEGGDDRGGNDVSRGAK
jgi:hypothetical protein